MILYIEFIQHMHRHGRYEVQHAVAGKGNIMTFCSYGDVLNVVIY